MSESTKLPDGWVETTFGAVVSAVSVNDKKLPRGQYLESGRFPVVDQGQQFIGGYSDDEARVISEDLPLLVFGDHTRAFKYLNQPFVPGADGIKVLKPHGVDAKWLYEIARALEFPDKGYARHYQHLKSAKLFVPPPDEQRRIVAEIEKQFTRLDTAVAALGRVRANLKRYRASVLKAACSGELVPTEAELHKSGSGVSPLNQSRDGSATLPFESGAQLLARILEERRKNWSGRGKYKEPAAPDTANLPPLPEGWTWATADQLTSVITDGEHITPERSTSGILLLSARNVFDGRISVEDVDYVPQHEYNRIAKRLVVAPGDVLLSCSGSVGRSAVVPEGLLFTLVRSVAVLKPLATMGKYLSLALRSPLLKQQITEKQTQTAQANIFQGKIKVLCVPLPPLAEQERIVAEVERRLSVVEELETVVSANLQRATRLRQSILQKAFEGKLV